MIYHALRGIFFLKEKHKSIRENDLNSNIDEKSAISCFYRSKLYKELSDEQSKLWHYSPLTLYTMYQDELLTGSYDYPEEA